MAEVLNADELDELIQNGESVPQVAYDGPRIIPIGVKVEFRDYNTLDAEAHRAAYTDVGVFGSFTDGTDRTIPWDSIRSLIFDSEEVKSALNEALGKAQDESGDSPSD